MRLTKKEMATYNVDQRHKEYRDTIYLILGSCLFTIGMMALYVLVSVI